MSEAAKPTVLPHPLSRFRHPTTRWRIGAARYAEYVRRRVTYSPLLPVVINQRPWLRIQALYHTSTGIVPYFFHLPPSYGPLWRLLVYSAIWWEKMYSKWTAVTDGFRDKKLTRAQRQTLTLRDNTGVKLVQYVLFRRFVLEELVDLRFDGDDYPAVMSLVEFGIRHFRDWLDVDFATARSQGEKYLAYDPTVPTNRKFLSACRFFFVRTFLLKIS